MIHSYNKRSIGDGFCVGILISANEEGTSVAVLSIVNTENEAMRLTNYLNGGSGAPFPVTVAAGPLVATNIVSETFDVPPAPAEDKPLFRHDCEYCRYLGHTIEDGKRFDLYFHVPGCFKQVVARYGDDPNDYYLGLTGSDLQRSDVLRECFRRSIAAGYDVPESWRDAVKVEADNAR